MPSLYTPFLTQAGASIGRGLEKRGINQQTQYQNKLAGDAYMGNPQAQQELMSVNPALGAKIMEETRKRKATSEQAELDKQTRTRKLFEDNKEIVDEIVSDVANFDNFEDAQNYFNRKKEEYQPIFGDALDNVELTDQMWQDSKTLQGDDQEKFQSTMGKLISDKQLAVDMFGEDSDQANAIQEVIDAEEKGEPAKLTDIGGMRKEFTKQSQDFIDIRASYEKLITSSDTGAGDVSLIFAFMRIIDPGSTVRETEFATAEQTAGIPTRIVTLYNKALRGDRLGPVQRENFKKEAGNLFGAQLKIQRELEGVFRGLATRQDINPDNVAVDYIGGFRDLVTKTDSENNQLQTAPVIQEGATATNTAGDKIIFKDGKWQPL